MTFPGRWTRVRILAYGAMLGCLFAAVGKRAFNLQVREAGRLREMAEEQYLREVELPPRRGRILDRNGAELASTADVDSIYCNPRRFADVHEAARLLSRVLMMDRKDLEKKLEQKRFFAWIKRKVTPDEAAAVKALALPGVAFVREPRRFYPNRALAATVMGLAGSDGRGLDGVELAFDKQLRGTTSSVVGIRDALGRDLAVEGIPDGPSGAGSDVVLSIDRYLTFVTERAIAEGQTRTHAKDVVAIVMDPQSGEILAMASVPSYNPNDPGDAAGSGARDRAITDTYEPGSTMKTFTLAAALDAGVIRPDSTFDCLMGKMMVGKYSIHDTHPHGVLTAAEVFKFSSNIGATKIARRLGRDGLADALARFGFGRPTGLGLPGERAGVIRPVDKWGDIGFANVSFGQGLSVTPLQMVTGVSAIAAGGVYRSPRIVSRVVQADGTIELPTVAPDRQVMSETAAHTMLGIMRGVTEKGGTALQAAIDGYVVGGKTGTAQKVANGHYDPDKWVSSFVGVVPIQSPRLAVIVVVDEPQGGHLGGVVAAPIFKDIAEQALRYLHVAPTEVAPVVAAAAAAAAPAKAKAASHASPAASDDDAPAEGPPTEQPVYADADGPGDDPAMAEQWNSVAGAEGGRALTPAGAPTAVPDFAGMTVGEAIRAAHKSGVELAFDDATGMASGIVLAQKPSPGPSSRGTLCSVTLGRRE